MSVFIPDRLANQPLAPEKGCMRWTSSGGSVELDQLLTDKALDCEVLVPKQRTFLRQHLQTEFVRCDVKGEAAQHSVEHVIAVRMALRPEADGNIRVTERFRRSGRFIFLIHDRAGPLRTSWIWLSLVRTLYKSGFSVILLDLPGMGASKFCGNSHGTGAEWEEHDALVLVQVMDALRIAKCHLVTCGTSCSALIRMVKSAPNRLEGEHILHNPVLESKQCGKLSGLLKNSGIRTLVSFDKGSTGRTDAAHDHVWHLGADGTSNAALSLIYLSDNEMKIVQTNTSVPLVLLVPSKSVAVSYATFLDQRRSKVAWPPSPSKEKTAPSREKSATKFPFSPCSAAFQPSQKQLLPPLKSDSTSFWKWQRSGSVPAQGSKRHAGHGAHITLNSEMGTTSEEPLLSLQSPVGGRAMQLVGSLPSPVGGRTMQVVG